jgi:hypothetical protein
MYFITPCPSFVGSFLSWDGRSILDIDLLCEHYRCPVFLSHLLCMQYSTWFFIKGRVSFHRILLYGCSTSNAHSSIEITISLPDLRHKPPCGRSIRLVATPSVP